MKVMVIYKYHSDHARSVLDYLRDFKRQTSYELEEVDPETRDGAAICRLYDIVEYPSVIAVDDNSVMQNLWRGLPLPTINEVSFYVR